MATKGELVRNTSVVSDHKNEEQTPAKHTTATFRFDPTANEKVPTTPDPNIAKINAGS